MSGFFQDLRQGARLLRRSPGFAFGVVLILAVGIGANAALFSVVSSVLLHPLPYPASDRLACPVARDSRLHFRAAFSAPDFLDYRESVPSFGLVAATRPWSPNVTGGGRPERVRGLLVSANFFSTLGVFATRGRTFLPKEERPGNENVVVVSDALWKGRFGSDPALVGKAVRLNDQPYQIVGIMPPGFRWGRAYGKDAPALLWAPYALTAERIAPDQRGNENLDLVGRLRPGASVRRAQSEVDALMERFRRDYPDQFPRGGGLAVTVEPLKEDAVGSLRAPLWILFGAVGFVLLIACTNVAGLLLARAAGRRSEIGIRLALGATRPRVVRQLLVESAVLASMAGLAGAALAVVFLGALVRLGEKLLFGLGGASIDGGVVAFTILVSSVTAILFGLAPALSATRLDLRPAIEENRTGAGSQRSRFRKILVASQLGLAALLLTGAGLLVNSLARLLRVDPGFDARHVLTAQISLPRNRYAEKSRRLAFIDALLAKLGSLPGATAAGMSEILPMAGDSNSSTFLIENHPVPSGGTKPHAENWIASSGYFPAMRVPLLKGRLFTPQDRVDSVPVVIIDEVLARQYFGREDPIGRRIDPEADAAHPQWHVVVGVVGNVKGRALDDEPRPEFYLSASQHPPFMMTLVVRSEGEPTLLSGPLRENVAGLDPDEPVDDIAPLSDLVANSVSLKRLVTTLLSLFAGCAMFLAALGLYGLLAYSVEQRRREIGIRVALGAMPGNIVALILGEGLTVIAGGIAGGVIAAAFLTRLLVSLLYGVAPLDFATYSAVIALLAAVALAASAFPAFRASRIDPMEALRHE